ncbi:uncharacterized protein LOC135484989 [Lineus longissimus]|uniref:uncharacterized protein LOC135484989 n=1 Tax=Lineus longissimus TaxID=88925 RepID=UPI00315D7A09
MGVSVSTQHDRSRFYEVPDDHENYCTDVESVVSVEEPTPTIRLQESCGIDPKSLEFTAVPFLRIRERGNGTCWNIPLDCFGGNLIGGGDSVPNMPNKPNMPSPNMSNMHQESSSYNRGGRPFSPLSSDDDRPRSGSSRTPSPHFGGRPTHHVDWSPKKVLPPISPSSSHASLNFAEKEEDAFSSSAQISEEMTERIQQMMQRETQRNDGDKIQRIKEQRKLLKERSQRRSVGQFNIPHPESAETQRNARLLPLRGSAQEAIFSESMNMSDSVMQQALFHDEQTGGFTQSMAKKEMSREFSRRVSNQKFTSADGTSSSSSCCEDSAEPERIRQDSIRSKRGKKHVREKPKKSSKKGSSAKMSNDMFGSLATTNSAFSNMSMNPSGSFSGSGNRRMNMDSMGSLFGNPGDRGRLDGRQGGMMTHLENPSHMRGRDSMISGVSNFGMMGNSIDERVMARHGSMGQGFGMSNERGMHMQGSMGQGFAMGHDRAMQMQGSMGQGFGTGHGMESRIPQMPRQDGLFRSPLGNMDHFQSFGLQNKFL